jgi:hypothetical protein
MEVAMIKKIDGVIDGPDPPQDGTGSVRVEAQTDTGPITVDLSLEAALALHDELSRYLEARVGV